jgi:holo-[acyl-carrier protein] synthase
MAVPFEILTGVDCEDVARWRSLLSDSPAALEQLFGEAEHRYCRSFPDPAPVYAGRWCAKEAVVKALLPRFRVATRDVAIEAREDGSPSAIVRASVDQSLAQLSVSISHSGQTALAVAVAVFHARGEGARPPSGAGG